MVGFPDQELHQNRWNFLSRDEIAFILRRIDRDRRDAVAEKWSLRTWANSAKDMKIWGYALIFWYAKLGAISSPDTDNPGPIVC